MAAEEEDAAVPRPWAMTGLGAWPEEAASVGGDVGGGWLKPGWWSLQGSALKKAEKNDL